MARPQRRARRFDSRRRRKVSILTKEKIDYVDYKDVTLLRRFISDRAKIRPRRVTGNNEQQQRAVALAIKNAREMALLPYENRITTQRRSSDRRSYEPEDATEGTEASNTTGSTAGTEASNTASNTASSMAGNTAGSAAGSEGARERRPGGAAASIPPPPRMQAAEPAGEDADQDKAHEAVSAIEDSSVDKSEEESAVASEQASEETAEAEDGESPTEEVPEEQQ